jgi:UDP-N-acetylmuramoyl-tripeptide--D-alanyl-D-alanine ligase
MIEMTLAEVAAVTGGTLLAADPAVRVTGAVEFDSRRVGAGGLFAAFSGERADGHDFAGEAVAAGAVAVLGSRAVDGIPMVIVAEPLAALGALARAVVDRAPALTVVGVTGSSGKTTTKDLLAQALALRGPTVAPVGSFNNELGHPYTALQVNPHTRYLVLEKGARGLGHVAHLCRVAPPRIGVVLNVGVAHIGEFGSAEAIAQAKGELVEALPAEGAAVLNLDDPKVAAMTHRTAAAVVGYSSDGAGVPGSVTGRRTSSVQAREVTLDPRGRPSYTLVTAAGTVRVSLGLVGAHQVGNTLAVAAVLGELAVPLHEVAGMLAELRAVSPRRMDIVERPDGVTVIDDSYNANPASVAVALRALAAMGGGRRRTVAVLGYLAELGDYEQSGHERVGRLAAELAVDLVVVVGEAAAPIHHAARGRRQWEGDSVLVPDQEQAVRVLAERLRPGDVVLVKGSRYQTWDVADRLRQPADSAAREVGP